MEFEAEIKTMPAQNHTSDEATEEETEQQENEIKDNPFGFDGSDSSSEENNDDEFLDVDLAEIRKDVTCPVCLGIIRKTRTVMECLHRFCKECIDKSIRLGNNECPTCRTHCASRRSLRDDPNFDALIAALYPDIDKYEDEEMALQEEEITRNKELQESIAQTLRRQNEAQGKRQTSGKAKTTPLSRSEINLCSARMKRRQSYHIDDNGGSNDNEVEEGINSSSADEHHAELGPKRKNTRITFHFSHPYGASASGYGGHHGSDSGVDIGATPALRKVSENLTWGSSGLRSRGSNVKMTRKSRNSNLIDHLRISQLGNDESGINLKLVPLDAHELPKLQQLDVICRPTSSVGELCKYVAIHNALGTNDIEIYLVQGLHPNFESSRDGNFSMSDIVNLNLSKHKVQVLQDHETLGGIQSTCSFDRGSLTLAYRKKLPTPATGKAGMHSIP